ncbi:sporulation protein [Vibrio chagasii]|nr:sporulation protein [Vibrio chagasii]
MSFLKKTLASFGIGLTESDSVLQQNAVSGQKGEHYCACVVKNQPQEIDNIDLNLCCRYVKVHNFTKAEGSQTPRPSNILTY